VGPASQPPARTEASTARSLSAALASLAASIVLALSLGAAGAQADVSCDRVAAPGGSDSAAGTVDEPFATVQKLADSLAPGETGCLRAGTYAEHLKVSTGGVSGAPVTLTSYPGEQATILGRMWIADSANYVVIENLSLDGSTAPPCENGDPTCVLPSPTVNGDDIVFRNDDVTNQHKGICFNIGSDTGYGRALNTVLEGNRIHDCGRLPSTNLDHGVYVVSADNTQIVDNFIYDNADRGVQLYPDAQYTTVANNVIDGNGEGVIFSGDRTEKSSNNTVRDNLITNAGIRYDVESYWSSKKSVGTNNLVTGNCVFGGANGNIQSPQIGFTAVDNLVADPLYVNRAAGDYRLYGNSPCLAKGPPNNSILDWAPPPPPPVPVDAAPTSATVTQGTLRSGSAASLALVDGSLYQVNCSGRKNCTAGWYGSFAAVPRDAQQLRISYAGGNSATCNQIVSIYRWTTSAWQQLDSRAVGTTSVSISGLTPSGSPGDYVSGSGSTGELRVRVQCTSGSPFYTAADQLGLTYLH
jgi:hypothetical protein